jgi:retron-type reverse transcriptase
MKTSAVTLADIADPDNLRIAFLRAARGKNATPAVVEFRCNLDANICALRGEILSLAPRENVFTTFRIYEPKERIINAPCFRERVLHHALIRQCEEIFERRLIADTYACRRGRGRETALRRAEQFSRRHRWFLKLDVSKYFDSIPHDLLIAQIAKRFRDAGVVELWRKIVTSYSSAPDTSLGIPIGSLTSQHLANSYLAPLDRFIKETLKIPGYVRYMDDMLLWADDKEILKDAKTNRGAPF